MIEVTESNGNLVFKVAQRECWGRVELKNLIL